MAAFIACIVLAGLLFMTVLFRWRGTTLGWPILLLALTFIGWSVLNLVDTGFELNYWMIEWTRLLGTYVALAFFLSYFSTHHKLLNFTILLSFVGWIVFITIYTDDMKRVINPAIAGFILLMMMQMMERAGNEFAETLRAEISTLGGALSIVLIWDLLSMLVLMLNLNADAEGLDVSRAIIGSIALAFGLVHIQRIDQSRLDLENIQQTYRPHSSLNIFAILCWLAVVGYMLIGVAWQKPLFGSLVLAASMLIFVWLAYKKKLFSQLKIMFTKLFASYKYDYRESWLGFNRALDEANVQGDFYQLSIKALANIISSPAGKLWNRRGDLFIYTDNWQSPLSSPMNGELAYQLPIELIDFIERTNWVVDIKEYQNNQNVYQGLRINASSPLFQQHQIFIPLRRGEELVAVVGLRSSYSKPSLNWEDHDLLKAAGQQMASYLALFEATTQIYEQEQFDAFNRLSAFVVHDLKNVTAQLELITHNAHRYRDNPEFVNDTFETVASATQRLNKMLEQLQRKQLPKKEILQAYIPDVFAKFKENANRLNLIGAIPELEVYANQEQLINIIQHLHQNAIDASKENDRIHHRFDLLGQELHWHIVDKGKGMDADFVRKQLFKPFATTKGNAGMGIGVYQCRYLLQSFGGDLIIQSELGKGTRCIVILQTLAPGD
ncbi:MAG: PEP-CTERM system histidine kinase PrsK [Kangiella sp.]|jgi:putative PEP-CTERM system histidine kinase|nr:PEP-CTERM system histidine kinase PrsK [Kangiella sp.]MCW9027687.1 PEP-CTERM system histidine kinase PrsK [Kangiella sp.]